MTHILGISGSLRKRSFNSALLRAAASLAPEGVTVEIGDIHGIPLYDGDVEAAEGIPAAVAALKDRIAAADGLLLVSPEYNAGIPGVFKNALDWCSRPPADSDRVFKGRPTAITGATPGMGGTRNAQLMWLPVLRNLGVEPWWGAQLYVAGAGKVFDAELNLADEKMKQLLADFIKGFAAFCAQPKR